MKKLILVLTAFFCLRTHATANGAAESENKLRILCEYRLTKNLATMSRNQLEESVFGVPFPWSYSDPYATDAAYAALGLRPKPSSQRLSRLILSLQHNTGAVLDPVKLRVQLFNGGDLEDVVVQGFPDLTPSVWRRLRLSEAENQMSHRQLIESFPMTPDILESNNTLIGFHSDVNRDGIRRFVKTENLSEIVLGIDVPCETLKNYSEVEEFAGEADTVRTLATQFCRVPVLYFGGG
jgi:hypothetical protein